MSRNAAIEPLRIQRRVVDSALVAALPGNLHPVLRRVYAARRVGPGQLDHSLASLLPVSSLGAAVEAAERLLLARERRERIVVIGDFDADGATASALVVSGLRELGFAAVDFLVPDRFRLGYGLSAAIAVQAAERSPDLLITVDNGVSSLEGVQRARELGMDVIVTDHHLPGHELPAASVIVNPNLPGETFAGKSLAGVGVAFYVLAALARLLEERGQIDAAVSRRTLQAGLDLVALGTVADLVPLDYNNRILVAAGLRRMRAGRARPGLQALFEVAGRNIQAARSSDLGFAVAPRLNAAGRLEDMSIGIACLLAPDLATARPLAARLDALNRQRRELQLEMEGDARRHLERAHAAVGSATSDAYCLFDEQWHEGVVGLVATRLKDQLRRPVVAFAPAEEAGMLKGSARSIRGVHIRDVLDRVAALHPQIIARFGGHAMAAGLTLRAADLDSFRQAFTREVTAFPDALNAPHVLLSDGEIPGSELGIDLAETLESAGPWGQGFAEPLFDGRLEVADCRVLKDRHLKLSLRAEGSARSIDAIAFNRAELPAGGRGKPLHVAYRLEVNEYRDRRAPQMVVEHMLAGDDSS